MTAVSAPLTLAPAICLWQTELPFAGVATPSTYMIDNRQYIVIAASGGRDPRSPVGGVYVAFSLLKRSGGPRSRFLSPGRHAASPARSPP